MEARLSRSDTIMNYSRGHPNAEAISLPCGDPFEPRPISAGNLVSLIDLGWSDY